MNMWLGFGLLCIRFIGINSIIGSLLLFSLRRCNFDTRRQLVKSIASCTFECEDKASLLNGLSFFLFKSFVCKVVLVYNLDIIFVIVNLYNDSLILVCKMYENPVVRTCRLLVLSVKVRIVEDI